MTKPRYVITTKGSITTVHLIDPPDDLPVARIVPLGGKGGGSAAAAEPAESRPSPKTKGPRGKG